MPYRYRLRHSELDLSATDCTGHWPSGDEKTAEKNAKKKKKKKKKHCRRKREMSKEERKKSAYSRGRVRQLLQYVYFLHYIRKI